MLKRRRVALLIEASNAYARGLLEGIAAYVRHHQSWSIYLPEQRRGDAPPPSFSRWHGDGLIARIETAVLAEAVRRLGLPTIDVSAAREIPAIPWVETDDELIARLAIDHFLERGYRHLAYCGDPRFNWSKWRCEHFRRLADEAGATCQLYGAGGPLPVSWQAEHAKLVRWVTTLPRPVGILACYDIKAQQLLDACRDAGAAVPEEVAVLGVDNDPVLCELSDPPLSSVIPDARRTGYLAAELLDRWMAGERVPAEAHRISPRGIQTRQSTDVLAIDDEAIAAVVRLIRQHACEGISVADLLREVPLSRRVLESRFMRYMGRSPHAEILRVKLSRAKQLLLETDLSVAAIAGLAGFEHPEYLSVAFKRETGFRPHAFRRQHQAGRRPEGNSLA
jgi:LacI family transcriptional regulator